ncbi:MAG: DUF3307 domain-containing protein [Spirochaetales bacterium]|nr:DUF3307 domain-containing protein [Spirochaetales bacterium]
MIALSIKLVLAHLLGDFVFQPTSWVKDKQDKKALSKYLYYHILLHIVLMLIVTRFDAKYLWLIAAIGLAHFAIDCGKLYLESPDNKKYLFFADQVLHLLVLAAGVYYFEPFTIDLDWLYSNEVMALLAALSFTTYAVSILLKVLLARFNPNPEATDTNSAGKYIGILERLFIFFFVLADFWEGVGFLLTAKSIFRFGDLKESKDIRLTEYILIGTLLSFAFGIGGALLYKLAISAL